MAELTVKATTENLDAINDFVNAQLEAAECPMKLMMQIDLALEEAYVNIAHYAYHPGTGEATVRCETAGGNVVLTLVDSGRPYNPLEKEDPDVTASAQERPVGGLGVFLVKKLMDDVRYERRGDQNVLIMKKAIAG